MRDGHKISKILITVLGLVAGNGMLLNTPPIIELSTIDSGRKDYVASEKIVFKPGYHFKATDTDNMHAYISDDGSSDDPTEIICDKIGETCDDNNACTTDDKYDKNCECYGQLTPRN